MRRAKTMARQAVRVAGAALDSVHRPPRGVSILIYHRVGRRTPVQVDLPLSLFTEQMAFLAAETTVVTLTDGLARLADASAPRAPMVAVTFDDGTADFAEVALPVLVEHGVPVTLYVATHFVEHGIGFPDDGAPITWPALRDAVSTGLVDVGSHTHAHALLDRLPVGEVDGELDRSSDLIGDRLGVRARHFAYPKAVMGSAAAERSETTPVTNFAMMVDAFAEPSSRHAPRGTYPTYPRFRRAAGPNVGPLPDSALRP